MPDTQASKSAALASAAAAEIAHRAGIDRHDVAVVTGSGWTAVADALGTPTASIEFADLTGFPLLSVDGHHGEVRSVPAGKNQVLVFRGRSHVYEGHGVDAVVHYVRVAAAAGCRVLVLTNGCGSLRREWTPGTVVLIADQINLSGASPLVGPTFVDLTEAYSARLRRVARSVDSSLDEGVYVQVRGPEFETPAEIRAYRTLGADLVGMSTAVETIAARAAGMEVLGISLVTNLAAGMTRGTLSHAEVIDAGIEASDHIGDLVRRLLPEV